MFLLFVSGIGAYADTADEVNAAVKEGNAQKISAFFNSSVDLKILEQEGVYSKSQAELIIKDFFAKHSVKSFVVVHKSSVKVDSQYIIGTLITSHGKYRTYFLLNKVNNKFYIQQFHIDLEDN